MPSDRVQNEQDAYDEGLVRERNNNLQQRFCHVNECRNNQRSEEYLATWIGRVIPDSAVLDYGCADGWMASKYLGLKPLEITGIDISPVAIEKANSLGLPAKFLVMDAHKMKFDDATFDAVIGRAILHHLDFEKAIVEIARILKPGGYAIFQEPLRDNPAAKLLRVLTPSARTRDELPLSRKQIEWADSKFSASHHHFSGLMSTGVGLITSLVLRHKPENALLKAADLVDEAMSKSFIRYWMRRVVLVWQK